MASAPAALAIAADVYGVSGLFSEIADNRAHGRHERLRVESFYESLQSLCTVVKRLAA